jgi:hypothetical protein
VSALPVPLIVAAAALVLAAPLRAQADTAGAAPADAAIPAVAAEQGATRPDSVRPRPPISPTGAFLRSLLLPGWGQSRLDRNVTAGLFISFEALAAAMVWKSQWQLEFARTRGKYVQSHLQEREDWIVLLVFNHLLAAAEAYVSAHLWDFPPALRIEVLPDRSARLLVRVPLR